MFSGYFISIEGGEGAGKTTAIQMMVQYLQQNRYSVIATREPGGIPIAEQIRNVILDTGNTAMDARTEALLYAAARRQHWVEKINPALQAGCVVICDRFIDSSLAYQGYARGLGMNEVRSINEFAVEGRMPDLTLWLDVSPEVGLARIHKDRGREINRLDLEKEEFHHNVREGYRQLVEAYSERIVRIDADGEMDSVHTYIRNVLNTRLIHRERDDV